jgi:hypothetical protein
MSGGVPPSSRARVRRPARGGYEKAAKLFERFTGHDAEEVGTVEVRELKDGDVVAQIGKCDGILYTAVRDGVTERYIHEFAAKDRPLFCVTEDGRQILLIGGRYLFTEKGIVDKSDRKNWPTGRA